MTRAEQPRPLEVLLVEDDPGDVRLTQEALAPTTNLHVAEDAERAMAFLDQQGDYAAAPRPDLILLDLNLPGRDGRELLEQIKAHTRHRAIPVVVLTTSNDLDDIRRAYELNANSFITKPVNWVKFVTVIKSIENFWREAARAPQE
jgi:chemotaxis family two-component system response regulator Rcp1